MIITRQWLSFLLAPNGKLTKQQLTNLGVETPPDENWANGIIGSDIDEDAASSIRYETEIEKINDTLLSDIQTHGTAELTITMTKTKLRLLLKTEDNNVGVSMDNIAAWNLLINNKNGDAYDIGVMRGDCDNDSCPNKH